MPKLDIVEYPNPVLTKEAELVTSFDEELHKLVSDMTVTMLANKGIGLAAPQVGVLKRVIVWGAPTLGIQQDYLINPDFLISLQETTKSEEACLSFPGISAEVQRYKSLTAVGVDLEGKTKTIHADGLLAIILQHETDHLNGVVFIDHVSKLKRDLLKKKMEKFKKKAIKKEIDEYIVKKAMEIMEKQNK